MEMFKLTYYKELKLIQRYCQVTKKYFKYFKSIYSSTVYLDKPLLKLPLMNIDKIMISKGSKELKSKASIEVNIQIYIKFTECKNINI
jgi:hypothetical protein